MFGYQQPIFERHLGFLIDSTITLGVNNGNLELKMQHVPNYLDSIWKTTGWEHVYSNYVGAEVNTFQTFQYGIFECRAKYAYQSGSWPAFWLFGGDGTPCPPGGYGSEIDIAELSCEAIDPEMMHVIHRYYPPIDCNKSNQEDVNKNSYLMSMTDSYSTYKLVWTPEKIQYFINDVLKTRSSQSEL
jgi:beta-glucanase (GH16 family)